VHERVAQLASLLRHLLHVVGGEPGARAEILHKLVQHEVALLEAPEGERPEGRALDGDLGRHLAHPAAKEAPESEEPLRERPNNSGHLEAVDVGKGRADGNPLRRVL
jgi:hypothetical protein